MCSDRKVATAAPQPRVRYHSSQRCGRNRSAAMNTTIQNTSVGSANQNESLIAEWLMPGTTPSRTGTSAVSRAYCDHRQAA